MIKIKVAFPRLKILSNKDFHLHTARSRDADFPPRGVVQLAKIRGLKQMSVTDHHTVDGLPEARAEARILGINFMNGVEITSLFKVENGEPRMLHILGYGFDLADIKADRDFNRLFDKIRELGDNFFHRLCHSNCIEPFKIEFNSPRPTVELAISFKELCAFAKSGPASEEHLQTAFLVKIRNLIPDINITPFEISKALMDSNQHYIRKLEQKNPGMKFIPSGSFTEALHTTRVDKFTDYWSTAETIDRLKRIGAQTSLAHAGSKYAGVRTDQELNEVIGFGIQGLEAYSPLNTPEYTIYLEDLARSLNLFVSGGSDFHRARKSKQGIGHIGHGLTNECDSIETILFRRNAYRRIKSWLVNHITLTTTTKKEDVA